MKKIFLAPPPPPRWRIALGIVRPYFQAAAKIPAHRLPKLSFRVGISWARSLGNNLQVRFLNQIALDDSVEQPSSFSAPLSAAFASRADQIAPLDVFVRTLRAEPGMLTPAFFLSSVGSPGWRPLIVIVSRGPQIVGLLYCKERVVAGFGIRVVFTDDALGAMIAARPDDMESVFACATDALLKHTVALRVLISSNWLPFLRTLETKAEVSFDRRKHHAHLALPDHYEKFLAMRGPHTRRNFRYYRRKSEIAGSQFIPTVEFSEFAAGCRNLLSKSAHQKSRQALETHLAMIGSIPSQITMGLRASDGNWIGLAGGWYVGNRAYLITQLNDRTRTRESISLVVRSYMIETLISRRCNELIFWEGSSAPISCFANYPDVFMAHLDVASFRWRLTRKVWAAIRRVAPANFSKFLVWFVRDT